MQSVSPPRPARVRSTPSRLLRLSLAAALGLVALQAAPAAAQGGASTPDPRVGLRGGRYDAAEALWNLRLLSKSPPAPEFATASSSDLAFTGNYAIQGNYNGWMIWDISNPRQPAMVKGFVCPASQSDVSVFRNLLFVSGEGLTGRLDCGTQGVRDTVSQERLRGLRIFDITDIRNPRNVGNVQTCRGSHTHTVVVDPDDRENVYVYISGSAGVRSPSELPGCVNVTPDRDPNSALFRIEVVKVPLANPASAAIVSSPRIFNDLAAPPRHGDTPADIAAARARGAFVVTVNGQDRVVQNGVAGMVLDSIVRLRGGTGRTQATAADSAAARTMLTALVQQSLGTERARPGPTQCHDITVYPEIGLAGGACEGYGMLLDISNPVNPVRIAAVADSNFSYWHSATFNNDGTKVLFSDEWGGGSQAKCRSTDPKEWGANALFTISRDRQMQFRSYYKLSAAQTAVENCVAHNGSLIPIPGRDVMVQAWYQGGISIFDWTDAARPREIAFFDRGPADSTRLGTGGSWSAYWYNGVIVSSEITRGLDVLELTPSEHLSQNEIDAAKTVRLEYLNAQGQPKFVWPPSFALSRAYLDQLERGNGLAAARITAARQALASAERATGAQRSTALTQLAATLHANARGAADEPRVHALAASVEQLAAAR
jgi:hypothetical protein